MNDEQYEVLIKQLKAVNRRIDNMDEDVNRIDRDMTGDRQQFDEFKIMLSNISEGIKNISNSIIRLQTRTKDAVKDSVAETISPVREQMDKLVEKKVIRVRIPTDNWTSKLLALWYKIKEAK